MRLRRAHQFANFFKNFKYFIHSFYGIMSAKSGLFSRSLLKNVGLIISLKLAQGSF